MNNTELVMNYVRKEHGVTLDDIAKNTGLSKDYISGLIDSQAKNYRFVDDIITIKGLGTQACVVCGENDERTISLKIPKGFLNEKNIDESIGSNIKGHEKCYESIGVFFRIANNIICYDCSKFHGEWIDGDAVKEGCYETGYEATGHKGCVASNSICNHFNPDSSLRGRINSDNSRKMDTWLTIEQDIAIKTSQGYKNLVAILEKAKLLR